MEGYYGEYTDQRETGVAMELDRRVSVNIGLEEIIYHVPQLAMRCRVYYLMHGIKMGM